MKIKIKKVYVFENEYKGTMKKTYCLSAKDCPDVDINGNWLYLKAKSSYLRDLKEGDIIEGEIENKTFIIKETINQLPDTEVMVEENDLLTRLATAQELIVDIIRDIKNKG